MKKLILTTVLFTITALSLASCNKTGDSSIDISLVEDILTIQAFSNEAVPEADIQKIVQAGVNAQSAINKQPWHFSVVTNKDVLTDLSEKMKSAMPKGGPKGGPGGKPPAPGKGPSSPKAALGDSPAAIIVSARDGSDFDAGLATELMTVEAVLLGYGTKIISSPTIVLNGPDKAEYQKLLDIPADMSVKAVILIGKSAEKKSDAISSATTRNPVSEVVSFIK